MRLFCQLAISLFLILGPIFQASGLEEIPEDWTQFSAEQIAMQEMIDESIKGQSGLQNLAIAKKYIIEGNLELAQFFLGRVDDKNRAQALVRDRYFATIAFINDDIKHGFELLSRPEFQSSQSYPQICLLRVLALLSRPATPDLEMEISNCRIQTMSYSSNQQYWLDNLERLKFSRQNEIRGTLLSDIGFLIQNNEMARIWLKTGLYFNQEQLILRHLATLPESLYASQRLRELIGLLYYRLGDHKMALEFIEDIESPNTQNIRGNIQLKDKKYELAFGHFQLGLMYKENSLNALERALPLSWILEQWDEGLSMVNRLIASNSDPRHNDALRVAFLIRKNEPQMAHNYITSLARHYKDHLPLEIELMRSFIALELNQKKISIDASERSCQRHEGVGCWIAMNEGLWENLGKTFKREDHDSLAAPPVISQLKQGTAITALKESVVVDQKDIEELDSQLVILNY